MSCPGDSITASFPSSGFYSFAPSPVNTQEQYSNDDTNHRRFSISTAWAADHLPKVVWSWRVNHWEWIWEDAQNWKVLKVFLISLLTSLKTGQLNSALATCLTRKPAGKPTHPHNNDILDKTDFENGLTAIMEIPRQTQNQLKSEEQAKVRPPTPKANLCYDMANWKSVWDSC